MVEEKFSVVKSVPVPVAMVGDAAEYGGGSGSDGVVGSDRRDRTSVVIEKRD